VSAESREPEPRAKPLAAEPLNERLFGPSTNGRSSAFGALCLGSNPSGPAKTAFSNEPFVSLRDGASGAVLS
jgi:hypothetical protein